MLKSFKENNHCEFWLNDYLQKSKDQESLNCNSFQINFHIFFQVKSDQGIVNKWKNPMLGCLCNNCHLFCCSQAKPILSWRSSTACLQDDPFTNKIDHFTDYDYDYEKLLDCSYYCPRCNPLHLWRLSLSLSIC